MKGGIFVLLLANRRGHASYIYFFIHFYWISWRLFPVLLSISCRRRRHRRRRVTIVVNSKLITTGIVKTDGLSPLHGTILMTPSRPSRSRSQEEKNKREEFPALLLCVCADGVRLDRNRNEAIGQRHYVYTSDGGGGLSHSIHPIEMRFYSLFSLLPSVMYCSADCHFCFAHQFSVLWAHQGAVLPLQIDGRKEEKNTRGPRRMCAVQSRDATLASSLVSIPSL